MCTTIWIYIQNQNSPLSVINPIKVYNNIPQDSLSFLSPFPVLPGFCPSLQSEFMGGMTNMYLQIEAYVYNQN